MSTFLLLAQASSVAAAANAAALEEMDWKLRLSNKELDLVNKWLDEAQVKPLNVFAWCRILTIQTVY